jgi:IrrE N-terminal-like domain
MRLAVVVLLLAGCATLSPAQEHSAAELRDFIDTVARAYGVRPVHLLVGADSKSIGGTYRRGMITVSTPVLFSRSRDSIIAHELGHYLLGHDDPLRGVTMLEQQQEQEQRELDANAKAVEILVRTGRLPEEQALSLMYDGMLGFYRAVSGGQGVVPWGHRHPCEEMADLLRRFPAHGRWTAGLECAADAAGAIAAAAPARDAARPAAPASPLISRAYFSDRLPARVDVSHADVVSGPPAVERFHPSRHRAVALVMELRPSAAAPRLVSRWHDEQGRERHVSDTIAAGPWQSHVTPMWMLRPYPGRWTAHLAVDGVKAGQYTFVVTSVP